MLDDENVLNQFYVRSFLIALKTEAQANLSKLSKKAKNLPKRPFSNLLIVAEDGAEACQTLKFWLDALRNDLKIPLILTNQIKNKYLNKDTLVLMQDNWFDASLRAKIQNQLTKSEASLQMISASHNEILSVLFENGVLSFVQLQNYHQKYLAALGWAESEFGPSLSTAKNLAKQIALFAVGKTAVFTSNFTYLALAKRFVFWWRYLAHNLAFSEELIEQMNSGNLGWSSHPIEKAFATFSLDFNSSESDMRLNRERSRLLSGLMPASRHIELESDNHLELMFKAEALAIYAATYLAVLNKQVLPH